MYEKLLLSTGGGIIDMTAQSDMDDAAVLAIGLGGTGIDALRVLKEQAMPLSHQKPKLKMRKKTDVIS